ncbi:alpha amylase catalytic region [Paenibacillus curdlanolyticus YK9]|uniref:Alpha-amylase n=1 Tax=Paenibacillus curdlanolyticus YK9 TaxID=717606 RepID=E0I7R7_9BACL|nr:alpha-amylase family glycosyl hydrolase [Paenibacillus curdlanolyticus]EFM11222.1 alpha amylase catalytic region [Paenibacillus curdlanolyticus YK9]
MRSRSSKRAGRLAGLSLALLLASALLLSACSDSGAQDKQDQAVAPKTEAGNAAAVKEPEGFAFTDTMAPMGHSSGVWYELFVRSFNDSNGDGVGDLNGVTNKLDYLQELGIKGIWLMPINPSPSYHGYDVTDQYAVNPDYGTLDDLKRLLDEAHKRGIKVIMDLVVNHTSSKHPWFLDSAKGKDSKHRDWYTWAEDKEISLSSLGPSGQPVLHASGKSHYLGMFSQDMPDLNFDNPEVRQEMVKVGQFWLKFGMDGLRLDAAKHIYEDFQSSVDDPQTSVKNKAWWQEFRQGMDAVNKDAYLIGEIWDSMSVVGPFLDHALNSGFNFDLSKILLDSAKNERANEVGSTLNRMFTYFSKQSAGAFVDAPFLSNHDGNRVMSEVGSDPNHARMAAAMLLTMPGNPFLYYGEEVGMEGMKPDERLREPMIWAADRKSDGQTTWEAASSNGNTVSVAEQLKDPNSMFNFYKKLISWRYEEPALGDGGIAPFEIANEGVLAYGRVSGDTTLLVVHNLTATKQAVDLNANGEVPFTKVRFQSVDEGIALQGGQLELPPYSTVILQ